MHLYFDCVRLVFVLLTCIVTTQRSLALCPQQVFKGNYGAIQSRQPPPSFVYSFKDESSKLSFNLCRKISNRHLSCAWQSNVFRSVSITLFHIGLHFPPAGS